MSNEIALTPEQKAELDQSMKLVGRVVLVNKLAQAATVLNIIHDQQTDEAAKQHIGMLCGAVIEACQLLTTEQMEASDVTN